MVKWIKRIVLAGFVMGCLATIGIVVSDVVVRQHAEGALYDNVHDVPHHKVGMVLGTVKFISNGHVNKYYTHRIAATVELYQAGKIDYVLISGDNCRKGYDEPTAMKEDLLLAGIPEDRLVLDYAGFRTLDSVVRCKAVFGQSKVLIISQKFHNERVLYIASHKDVSAVAFNAQGVSRRYGIRVQIREYLARVKMMLDLLFGVQPHFLGDKVVIG